MYSPILPIKGIIISGFGLKQKIACSCNHGRQRSPERVAVTLAYLVMHLLAAMVLSGIFLRKMYNVVIKATPRSTPQTHGLENLLVYIK